MFSVAIEIILITESTTPDPRIPCLRGWTWSGSFETSHQASHNQECSFPLFPSTEWVIWRRQSSLSYESLLEIILAWSRGRLRIENLTTRPLCSTGWFHRELADTFTQKTLFSRSWAWKKFYYILSLIQCMCNGCPWHEDSGIKSPHFITSEGTIQIAVYVSGVSLKLYCAQLAGPQCVLGRIMVLKIPMSLILGMTTC